MQVYLDRRRQETYTVSTAGQKYLKAALPILMDVYKRTEDLLPEQWFRSYVSLSDAYFEKTKCSRF